MKLTDLDTSSDPSSHSVQSDAPGGAGMSQLWPDEFPDSEHLADIFSLGHSDELEILDFLLEDPLSPTPWAPMPDAAPSRPQAAAIDAQTLLDQLPSTAPDDAAASPTTHNSDLLTSIIFNDPPPPSNPPPSQLSPHASTQAGATTHHPPSLPVPVTTGYPPSPPRPPSNSAAIDALLTTHLPSPTPSSYPVPPSTAIGALLDNPLNAALLALVDNPLNAALLSAQLPRPPRNPNKTPASRSTLSASPGTPPIAKPKRKKLRPADKLNTLQSHLDTITARLTHLTLTNRWLHRKHAILQSFVQFLDQYETLASCISADITHHKAHPDQPPRGAALYQLWTPQQFVDYQCAQIRTLTRLLATIESGSGCPTPATAASAPSSRSPALPPAAAAALAELAAESQNLMHVTLFACHGRGMDFFPQVLVLLAQCAPVHMPEVCPPQPPQPPSPTRHVRQCATCMEEHWRSVVDGMELTEGQVEDLLVAREVFLSVTSRMEQEQVPANASLEPHTHTYAVSGGRDTEEGMVHLEEHVVHRMAIIVRRHQGILIVLTLSIFLRTLTPLQVARCILHAHPLMAEPVIIMNTIHALRSQTAATAIAAAPVLGPPPSAWGTIFTMHGMMCQSIETLTRLAGCGMEQGGSIQENLEKRPCFSSGTLSPPCGT